MFYLILWLIVGREQKKKMKLRISVTDLFVGIYAVAVVLSYLCSGYKSVALWGTESWYMGFIVALTGDIMTMPGLPKKPAAFDIDVNEDGVITGLF